MRERRHSGPVVSLWERRHARTCHVRCLSRRPWRDQDIEMALDTASYNGAKILGLEKYGLDVGCKADLVVVPARNVAEAVVSRPLRNLVVKNGQIVMNLGFGD
ncbi:amidohydrolase family protein [Pseudarthrobacter sp. GA104]|nr:amidohydrolase family protein [Pseudarthrobacter sp. GA104]